MSSTQVSSGLSAAQSSADVPVPLRFEVAVVPVSNVDRAKGFYQGLGWRLDADIAVDESFRVVQFTPPGSPTSIQFGVGMTSRAPGSADGMYLVVDDMAAARADLINRGAEVSEIWHGRGPGTEGHLPGGDPDHTSYRTFASFTDPDGNSFLLQEITDRLPGRCD
jgi:catechol 2,3-dioxygenase-like lactoylglutathione lyase family enzyme